MSSRDPERPPYNVQCPKCGVFAGQPCRSLRTRRVTDVHSSRLVRAYSTKENR